MWRGGADIVLGCLRYEIQGMGSIARRRGSCRWPKQKLDHGHGSGEETRRRSKGRAQRQLGGESPPPNPALRDEGLAKSRRAGVPPGRLASELLRKELRAAG
jgi:hypothetical protein